MAVLDPKHFEVVWTTDNWKTKTTTCAVLVGYPGFMASLPVMAQGTLEFALHWFEGDRWTPQNYRVVVT